MQLVTKSWMMQVASTYHHHLSFSSLFSKKDFIFEFFVQSNQISEVSFSFSVLRNNQNGSCTQTCKQPLQIVAGPPLCIWIPF